MSRCLTLLLVALAVVHAVAVRSKGVAARLVVPSSSSGSTTEYVQRNSTEGGVPPSGLDIDEEHLFDRFIDETTWDVPKGTPKLIRKNFLHLTEAEKQQVIGALSKLKMEFIPPVTNQTLSANLKWTTWDYMNLLHNYGATYKHIHVLSRLLPWHRAMSIRIERELQRITGNYSLALPYWDFTDAHTREAIFDDKYFGGNSSRKFDWKINSGPFSFINFNTTVCNLYLTDDFDKLPARKLGVTASMMTECAMAQLLSAPVYATEPFIKDSGCDFTFVNILFKMHFRVHLWIDAMTDCWPAHQWVFWLVHSMWDKIWGLWQKLHWNNTKFWGYRPNKEPYVGAGGLMPGDMLWASNYTTADILNPNDLPFEYAIDRFDALADLVKSGKCTLNSTGTDACLSDSHEECSAECGLPAPFVP